MVDIKPFQAHSLLNIEKNITRAKGLLYAKNEADLSKLLVQKTEKAAIYLYRIDYSHPETGAQESVYGFVALMKLDKPETEKQVFGHERTFEEKAEEFHQCFKACHVHFNPIVVIYKDYAKVNDNLLRRAEKKEPIIDAHLDTPKARHRVWAFDDPGLIKKVKAEMKARRVIVADGHHRYRAMKIIDNESGVPWIMTMFVDVNNPGLALLPWHRVLRELDMEKFNDRLYNPIYGFKIYEAKTREDMLAALKLNGKNDIEGRPLAGHPPNQTKGAWQCLSPNVVYFGLQFKGDDTFYLITIDDIKLAEMAAKMGEKIGLELTLLHIWLVNKVIPKATPVAYFSSVEKVDRAIKKSGYQLGIYLPAMEKDDVILKAVWEKKPIPEKATCFRPKAKTGVLFWKMPQPKKQPKA